MQKQKYESEISNIKDQFKNFKKIMLLELEVSK